MEYTTHNETRQPRLVVRDVLFRTLGTWLILMIAAGAVFSFTSPKETSTEIVLVRSMGSFAAILCFFAGIANKKGEARTLTFLYCLFFSIQIPFGLTASISTAQFIGAQAVFHLVQYENLVHSAFLIFVCTYVLSGVLLAQSPTPLRLIFAVIVTVGLVGPSSLQLVSHPNYLYTLPDVTDFRAIDREADQLRVEGATNPTAQEVSNRVALSRWQGLRRIGELDADQERARVAELLPFLEGDNYVALLNRPLYRQYAIWAAAAVGLLITFFVINYFRDLPKPAHFEKIHFTLLIYSVFECFHAMTLASTTTYEEFVVFDQIGKHLTAIVLVLFIMLVFARLNFLSKSVGTFYEEKLNADPDGVSRWRDSMDRFLLRQFHTGIERRNRFIIQRPRK